MDIQYRAGDHDAHFEDTHWWVRSRFLLIDRAMNRLYCVKPLRVLEIGCGTGVNLRYLEQRYADKLSELTGTDPYAEPLTRGKITIQKEIPAGEFDLVLAMDVLEHTDTPTELLAQMRDRLRPAGILLVTVPAFQWLWTSYDEVAHHKKRYSIANLQKEVLDSRLKIERLFFLFSALFPLFVLQRLWIRATAADPHIFKPVHPWINAFLYGITKTEIHTWMPYNRWFGSSIVAIARREANG